MPRFLQGLAKKLDTTVVTNRNVFLQAPAAKKVVKKTAKSSGAAKKKTKAVESYKIYIYKVLKQVR